MTTKKTSAPAKAATLVEAPIDRRAQRRETRRADNRLLILDAAEQVFGEHGLREGSLRRIAAASGFSTAAIYLFFDNKQHLLADTLTRRGDELIATLQREATRDLTPLDKLHRIVDATVMFFTERPQFREMLSHLRGGPSITGPTLAEFADDVTGRFDAAMNVLAELVRDGQAAGQIRDGDQHALAHLYSVLINEHIFLSADRSPTGRALTTEQFHALVDGALRIPPPTRGRKAPR
jgi:AcrR family transcriptional regulator